MDNKNYLRLTQFKAFLDELTYSMEKYDCIEEIFKLDSDINYQIPALDFIQLENPEIIGCTALHLASSQYKTSSFEKLLNYGADFTIKNNQGKTVLHKVVEKSYNKAKEFWKLKGQLKHPRGSLVLSAHVKRNILSNPCDNDGMSHFHIACMLNHVGAVKFFLDGGVSPNEAIKDDSTRLPAYTPLHIAARYCCFETTQLLLEYAADKYSKSIKSMTPLHLLVERRMEIMDHIHMDKRAAFDFFKDELDLNERIVKLFLESDDIQDYAGLSQFQAACTLQDTSLIAKLLDKRRDLDCSIDKESSMWPGYTALHFSAHCNFKTVKELLSFGANVFAKDGRGVTPFDLCIERHQPKDLYLLLIEAMRQMNVEDIYFSDGKTKLVDFVRAMQSTYSFATFMANEMKDINIFIPRNSPLWPGYTLLHVAVVLPERIAFGIEELYETSDYVEEDCPMAYYNCKEIDDIFCDVRIAFLLQFGADSTVQDAHGSTPIHLAFPKKSEKIFDWLFNDQTKPLNHVAKNGLSHLHVACATEQQLFVDRTLAVSNDKVDQRTTSDLEYRMIVDANKKKIRKLFISAGSTLMHVAVAACDFSTIGTLLEHNTNIYTKDSLGMTPIHLIMKTKELINQRKRPYIHQKFPEFNNLLLATDNLTDCVTDFGLSHLHVASHADDDSAIIKMLDAGANIDIRINLEDYQNESLSFLTPYDSYTPLQIAICKKNDKASEILAKRGADFLNIGFDLLVKLLVEQSPCKDIFVRTVKADTTVQRRILENYGLTLLHIACVASDVDTVAELLNNGADPNTLVNSNTNKWSGYSPLHLAVLDSNEFDNRYRIIELLMEHGADITLTNPEGNTPVQQRFHEIYPLECGYLEPMLKNPKDCILNPTNAKGVSHFHAACVTDNVNIVEEFLKHGVDINLKIDNFPSGYGGYTSLHLAVYHNYVDTIDSLLKYGADPNATNSLGRTPFLTAAKHSMNFENLCDKFVSAGAEVHAKSLLGTTALEEITEEPWNTTEIKLLVKHGHRLNSYNPFTQQGLIGLALNESDDLLADCFYKAIIEASDSSDIDDMGRTPLHNIVSCGGFDKSVQAIRELLKIGYDIDHQDKQGRTSLHHAVYFYNEKGIIGLLECGADINILDDNERTAFAYFLERTKLKIAIWYRQRIKDIIKIFFKHIYKLKLVKLHVNVLDNNVYTEMLKKINFDENFKLDCKKELQEMKIKTIDSLTISLFDILSSETRVIAAYPNMPLVKRQVIDAFFKTNRNVLLQDFPQFHCLLRLQYTKVSARIDLVESGKFSLNTHIRFTMPDLCSNIIFLFLSNQDLKNLISSTVDCLRPRKRRKLD